MDFSDTDKIQYLANLVAAARSDAQLTPGETRAIEDARERIGAKRSLLQNAEICAATDGFSFQPVGTLSVRVANLEDMIMVSGADGAWSDSELHGLLDFSNKIGLTEPQFEDVLREVTAVISGEDDEASCPSCGSVGLGRAKFCANCGANLEYAPEGRQATP